MSTHRPRRTPTLALLAAVGLALSVTACSSEDEADATPVHVPGATTSSQNRSTGSAGTTHAPTSSIVTTGPVQVTMRLEQGGGPAGEALRAFLLARTRSIIARSPSPALRAVSSAAEFARQQKVIADVRQRGLTVPTRPQAAVVAARSPSAGRMLLGVCLWLPSTEFVDELTGVSPAGPVPEEWLPAVAEVSKRQVTWVVDKLMSPTTEFVPDCGVLS